MTPAVDRYSVPGKTFTVTRTLAMVATEFPFPEALRDLLLGARHIAVLTGAGVSAESGVPTFREAQTGLWSRYDPTELATPEAFQRNPQLVWDWYAWRRQLVLGVEPNAAHHALAALAHRVPRLDIITQNVDRLHQRAGSTEVIELHGCLLRIRRMDGVQVEHWDDEQSPPRCPDTGQLLRPDVVWFGEPLPQTALDAAMESTNHCDLFFSVGTSSLVYPAAELPFIARGRQVPVVEINPDQTPLSDHADHVLRGPAGIILPKLLSIFD